MISFDKNKKALGATTDVNTTTNIITISSHGFLDNELVTYTLVGTTEIGGLTNGNSYFIIN